MHTHYSHTLWIVTVRYSTCVDAPDSDTYTLATCHSYEEAADARAQFFAHSPFAEFASVDIQRV